jgi:error-prone DNA polymerase
LVYVSSWIKCYYPDVFACALLNSMPMGFYQPAQIIIDAQKHGVEVRPVDVNYSDWDNKLESKSNRYYSLRLGFRQVKGLREEDLKVLTEGRDQLYTSIFELRKLGLSEVVLGKLADADAFRSIGHDRRNALWEVSTKDRLSELFSEQRDQIPEEKISLPEMPLSEHVIHDYAATSLSLKAHPVSFVRSELNALGILSTSSLENAKDKDFVKVAGLILVRQRPGTASGICFITIEDETGTANLVVFKKLFDQYRKEIIQSKLIMVEGQLQREGEVIHVIVRRCYNYSKVLRKLVPFKEEDSSLESTLSRADEITAPVENRKEKMHNRDEMIQGNIFPEGRNFR